MRWVHYARAWLLGPARREHIERYRDNMPGDLTFPDATITIHIAALNVYGNPSEVMDRLGQIAATLQSVQTGVAKMPEQFNRLSTEVTEATDVMESARILIEGLAQEIRDAAGNEEASKELADKLDANANALSKAVADNTKPPAGGTPNPPEGGPTVV